MWGMLIPAAASLFGSMFGAKKQSDSAKYAAQLQANDNAASLAFMRQQAQNAYANNEVTRRANYDQWAARERRLAQLWQARGWGTREIPAYVGGVDPQFVAKPTINPRLPAARRIGPVSQYLPPGATATTDVYPAGTIGWHLMS